MGTEPLSIGLRKCRETAETAARSMHVAPASVMTIDKLFSKCPVLPVDASISLAKYLRNIRQALEQSKGSEEHGDIDRAALLQIRVLQLICKTLPSHPEYKLTESRSVVKEMRGIAHRGFANVERLAELMDEDAAPSRDVAPPHKFSMRPVEMSIGVIDLFERIAMENSARSLCTIGYLAGKIFSRDERSIITVTALVIPSQTSLPNRSDVRYEADVVQLLRVKELMHVGFIQSCPNLSRLTLSAPLSRMLAEVQASTPEAVAVTVAPSDSDTFRAYSLAIPDGLGYVLDCAASQQMPVADVIPRGEQGGGQPIWRQAKHADIRNSAEPAYKLYDVRPVGLARDEEERKARHNGTDP